MQMYKVALRLLAPMHIGWQKVGNLQQTRPYVTGQTLWGAMVARLVRDAGESNYDKFGTEVDEQLAFTYFFPSLKPDPDMLDLWPWDEKCPNMLDLWPWDEKCPNLFHWRFLGSYASTALQDGHSSEEGSLHETEYVAPYSREGDLVYLVGYIFEKDDCTLQWKSALKRLQLGGERGYGWGRTSSRVDISIVPEKGCCFGFKIKNQNNNILITIPKDKQLPAHAIATNKDIPCAGEIEPLIGRTTDTTSSGFGGSFKKVEICWSPGGTLEKEYQFRIGARGVLEVIL